MESYRIEGDRSRSHGIGAVLPVELPVLLIIEEDQLVNRRSSLTMTIAFKSSPRTVKFFYHRPNQG